MEKGQKNLPGAENKLIICVVNRGFAEEVMDAARHNGATGGTILHGKGTSQMAHTVLGMKIVPEKELILILASKEQTAKIMEGIFERAGLGTPGSGICFALPVEDVIGLQNENPSGEEKHEA